MGADAILLSPYCTRGLKMLLPSVLRIRLRQVFALLVLWRHVVISWSETPCSLLRVISRANAPFLV